MKTTMIAAVAAASILAPPASASTITDFFSSYYAFGDSLTDDGKLPDDALHPVSDDGRFSNGPTWAEYISAEFTAAGKNTGNLALGGATGDDENFDVISGLSTFAGQVAAFTSALAPGGLLPVRTSETDIVLQEGATPGSNPLVSVLFGGNDMFQAVQRASEKMITVQQVLEDAADAVAQNIRDIAALEGGSTFDDFLVLNVPGGGLAEFYNARLALNMTDLHDTYGLNIISLNTDDVFGEIIFDALANGGQEFKITNVTDACTFSLNRPDLPSCIDAGIDPNTIALVDAVHPNAVVHNLLGTRAIEAVVTATVPLPAGLPLMLLGLGAFAAVRRRTT